MNSHQTFDLIVGAAFVLIYASQRFNTPSTNRSSTTAGRYYLGVLLYCLVGLIFYGIMVHAPYLVIFFAQGHPVDVPSAAKELSSPLVVALLLTVALAKVPLLN